MSTDIEEVKDRVRRIETRLTAYLERQGFPITGRQPRWTGKALDVPSPDCSLKACAMAIPAGVTGVVDVQYRGKTICQLFRGE